MTLYLAAGNETTDVEKLPAGTYFIRCLDVENRKESKFKMVKLEKREFFSLSSLRYLALVDHFDGL